MDIFDFGFCSQYNNANHKIFEYHVYSTSMDDIKIFLNQHSFPSYCTDFVKVVTLDDVGVSEYNISQLRHYLFRSNKHPGENYDIVTSYKFIQEAIEHVGQLLSDSLTFGTPAVRTEIEIFKIINDLVDQLPHATVLDHTLIDGDSGQAYSNDWERYLSKFAKVTNIDEYTLQYSVNTDMIIESILDDSEMTTYEIQPITLESYVKYFTIMMVDEIVCNEKV